MLCMPGALAKASFWSIQGILSAFCFGDLAAIERGLAGRREKKVFGIEAYWEGRRRRIEGLMDIMYSKSTFKSISCLQMNVLLQLYIHKDARI